MGKSINIKSILFHIEWYPFPGILGQTGVCFDGLCVLYHFCTIPSGVQEWTHRQFAPDTFKKEFSKLDVSMGFISCIFRFLLCLNCLMIPTAGNHSNMSVIILSVTILSFSCWHCRYYRFQTPSWIQR